MPKISLRIFVSSPGDVGDERRIAERVIERLRGKYAAASTLEAVLWEHEPVRATATFQEQIVPPADCDIVTCVLWSKLGTRLPGEYRRPDGTIYDSGTAFEFETARSAWERTGTPDLLVYRKIAPPIVDVRNRVQREARAADWDRLESYLDLWFRNPDGSFSAGFSLFERPDEFEKLLEGHLDRLIANRLSVSARAMGAEAWLRGSPYRGLQAFDLEHQAIFHGRTRAVSEIKDRLARRAASGAAFLMVFGASGSGKSSLVRAGLLPAITTPGVIEGVGLWRYCVMKPSEAGDPLTVLLGALASRTALPELAQGDFGAAELVAQVRDRPVGVVAPVRAALERAASVEQNEQRLEHTPVARLAVVVDQFEELFTAAHIDAPARTAFVAVIEALAQSGFVWVITTLRSEFFHRCSEVPGLGALRDGLGSYELLPPERAEIAQMIRNPATAAGLQFEKHPQEGSLDEVLEQAAAKDAASLPLLEFVLDALYTRCTDDRTLSFDAYHTLGGLEGAIARRADVVVQRLSQSVQAALPAVFRALVTVRGDIATARVARMSEFHKYPERSALIAALVEARLLITDDDGAQPIVCVVHEAVFNRWPAAQLIIRESRADLIARERVYDDAAQWIAEGCRRDMLLPAGKRLLESAELMNRRGEELDGKVLEYIQTSQAADRRNTVLRRYAISGAFVLLAGLFGAAVWQWRSAQQQADLAVSRELATMAEEALAGKAGHYGGYQESLLIALAGLKRARTNEALAAVRDRVESEPLLEQTLWVQPVSGILPAFSRNGEQIALYYEHGGGGRVDTFDLASGRRRQSVVLAEPIRSMAWGQQLVGIARDRAAVVTIGAARSPEIVLPDDCGETRGLGADEDGAIVVACNDYLARATPTDSGWTVARAEGPPGHYGAVAPNGRHAAFGLVSLWHADAGGRLAMLEGSLELREDSPSAMDDDAKLVAVPCQQRICVWALDMDVSIPTLILKGWDVAENLAFAPDGRRLAATYRNGRAEIYALDRLDILGRPLAATHAGDEVVSLAFSPRRGWLAAATSTGYVTIDDVTHATPARVLNGTPGKVHGVTFASGPGGVTQALAIVDGGSFDRSVDDGFSPPPGRLAVHRISDWGLVAHIVVPPLESLAEMSVGSFRDLLFAIEDGGRLDITANALPSLLRDAEPQATQEPPAIAFSRHRQAAGFMNVVAELTVLDLVKKTSRVTRLHTDSLPPEVVLAIADSGITVVAQHSPTTLVLVPTDGVPLELWKGNEGVDRLDGVDISPQGDRIAATIEGKLRIWEHSQGGWLSRTLGGGQGPIKFDDQGTQIYVDGRILDIASNSVALQQPLEKPESVIFDPSGRYLAASTDRDVRVWDTASGASTYIANRFPHGAGLHFHGEGILSASGGRAEVEWSLEGVPSLIDVAEPIDDPVPIPVCNELPRGTFTGYSFGALPDNWINPTLGNDPAAGGLTPCVDMKDSAGAPLQVGMRGGGALILHVPVGDWIARACRMAGQRPGDDDNVVDTTAKIRIREICPDLGAAKAR